MECQPAETGTLGEGSQISFRSARKLVRRRFGPEAYDHLLKYLSILDADALGLWGDEKPPIFLEACLVVTLYHDQKGIGFIALKSHIILDFYIGHNSLAHNATRIRLAGYVWGRLHVVVGDREEWDERSDGRRRAQWLRKINLWMDSTDVRIRRNKARGSWDRKHHSYKENAPGLRYMVVTDGWGVIRMMRGGYSPKTYDGHYLEWEHTEISKQLHGGHIAADNHFKAGVKLFRSPKFYVTGVSSRIPDSENDHDRLTDRTKTQGQRDLQLKRLRGRVERPFAHIKNSWAALSGPFDGEPEQLNCLVWMAVGAYNITKEGGARYE